MKPTRHRDDNTFTHVGLCVARLDVSVRFYKEALAFDEVGRHTVTDPDSARMLGIAGLNLELVFIERDGIRLELLWHHGPGNSVGETPRPMNRVGLTHLCFRVGNVDELCDRINNYGGVVLSTTEGVMPTGARGIMTLDPDGTRIELIERLNAGAQ